MTRDDVVVLAGKLLASQRNAKDPSWGAGVVALRDAILRGIDPADHRDLRNPYVGLRVRLRTRAMDAEVLHVGLHRIHGGLDIDVRLTLSPGLATRGQVQRFRREAEKRGDGASFRNRMGLESWRRWVKGARVLHPVAPP